MKQLMKVASVVSGRSVTLHARGSSQPIPATVEQRGDSWVPTVGQIVLAEQAQDGQFYVSGGV